MEANRIMNPKDLLTVIFEDESYKKLRPLTLTRPVYGLRCGPSMLYEKILRALPRNEVVFFLRDYLIETFYEKIENKKWIKAINDLRALSGKDLLIVNGGWIPGEESLNIGEEFAALTNDTLVYAYVKRSTAEKFLDKATTFREFLDMLKAEIAEEEVKAKVITNLWNLIQYNKDEIIREFEFFKRKIRPRDLSGIEGVYVVGNREDVLVSESARIYPCVVFDSSKGPIIVDENVKIFPNSFIEGPAYIGRDSWIVGGKIMSGVTIGPVCRVGGEVEEAVIHGYSNKYHEGFLGHSYVGEWVNIGAITTTSDLRNDYEPVKVVLDGELVDTGELKLGSFIGDHTKVGIASMFNTGSLIGVMCNLVTSGEPYPKYIPSFVWYIKGQVRDGPGIDLMLKSAERMMARRGVSMSKAEEKLYRRLYKETERERREFAERILGER